ncbi:unnamed protein product [Amoebophrya sp. A25]|nr:unnamed protein product [Amoebophrya sp. A25]|eukprot:GSA25T00023662001.1
MFQCKLKMALLVKFHRAARLIQVHWVSCQKRAINMVRDEELKRFARLRDRHEQNFAVQRQAGNKRRLEVHLLSLSGVPENRRGQIHAFQSVQNAQLSRLFRLGYCGPQNDEPPPDLVLVCSKPVHDDLLEYFAKVMEYRGIQNPQGRLQVLVPEKLESVAPAHMSLSHSLLLSKRAMNRLRVLIRGREDRTVLVPGHGVTFAELQLSAQLSIPLFGANPKNVDYLSTKSAMQRLVTLSQLPTPPMSVDLYDEEELFLQFATQIYENPTVPKWLLKIDDEFRAKGNVVFHVDTVVRKSIHEVQRQVVDKVWTEFAASRRSQPAVDRIHGLYVVRSSGKPAQHQEERDLREALIRSARDVLARCFYRKALLCASGEMYPNEMADFVPEFCRRGGVIQAVPTEEICCFPSVHFQISPDKRVQVLGTSEFIFSASFEPVGCFLPLQNRENVSMPICEAFARNMGRVLASKDIWGHASVDLVCFENSDFVEEREAMDGGQTSGDFTAPLRSPEPPGMDDSGKKGWRDRQKFALVEQTVDEYRRNVVVPCTVAGSKNEAHPVSFWVVDVDARLTDTAAAFSALQFVGQCDFGKDGNLHLAPHAPGYSRTDSAANERVALVVFLCEVPGLASCTHSQIFSFCKSRKVTYDLFQNTGVLFLQLDLTHDTVSFLVIDRTPKLLLEKTQTALQVLQNVSLQSSKSTVVEDRRGEDSVPHIREVVAAIRSTRKKMGLL